MEQAKLSFKNEIIEVISINGEEYSVYYYDEESLTKLPCPMHGNLCSNRVQRRVKELAGIYTKEGFFQVRKEGDLFLLRQILGELKKIVEADIICDECLRALAM
jgi:hypothetical protein